MFYKLVIPQKAMYPMNHTIEKERIVHLSNSSNSNDLQLLAKIESASSLKFNLQYSLRLIEASIDYLVMTNTGDEAIDIHHSSANVDELVSLSSLNDESGKYPCTKEMVKELLKDHERIILQLQKRVEISNRYQDYETVEFVSSIIEEHQNIAGKFRRYF